MKFIKTIEVKHPGRGHSKFPNGYIRLSSDDRYFFIKIPVKDKYLGDIGFIEDGIGINLCDCKVKKSIISTIRTLSEEDMGHIPNNLQGSNYKFYIPAEKLSDNEYVFKFDKAIMKKIKK